MKISEKEFYQLKRAMSIYGGSFSKAIAHALEVADNRNKQKLLNEFSDLLLSYKKFIAEDEDE